MSNIVYTAVMLAPEQNRYFFIIDLDRQNYLSKKWLREADGWVTEFEGQKTFRDADEFDVFTRSLVETLMPYFGGNQELPKQSLEKLF